MAIPKQIYVVSMKHIHHEYSKPDYKTYTATESNFGFLHPHTPGSKTDDSRKNTQHDWAYRNEQYRTEDGTWMKKGVRYDWENRDAKGYSTLLHYDEPIDIQYAPRVWENTPQTGFKIIDTVNRYRGNKLFKVLDPRGVEFEVTVAALFIILQEGEISHGIIKNPCVWKANKNLVIAE